MSADNREAVVSAMHALGAAWRGDWSDFDGRTLRDQLGVLEDALRPNAPATTARALGLALGICVEHGAHDSDCWECKAMRGAE